MDELLQSLLNADISTLALLVLVIMQLGNMWKGRAVNTNAEAVKELANAVVAQSNNTVTISESLNNHTSQSALAMAALVTEFKEIGKSFVIMGNEIKTTVQTWDAFQKQVGDEHTSHLSIIKKIQPSIDGLTIQQAATEKSNKGVQTIMEDVIKTQSATNGEVLKALQKIQQTLDELKTDVANRVEKIEQDVNAIKADLEKPIEPAPGAQPIVAVIPQKPTIKIVSKTEKDKTND